MLAVGPSAQNDADPILQLTDANKLSQGWRMTPTDGGFVSITTLATQKAIQVAGGSSADDALLEQWTYWGGSHQQWRLVRNGEGYVSLLNRNSGKALSVRNASLAEGASMSQMPLGTGFQQQWSIEERSCTDTPAANQAPVAVATSTSLTGSSPLSVTFTASKSYDPDGDPITYEWNFGDGSSYSSEANPVKVFTARAGSQGVGLILNYTVQLTIIDSKGLRSPVQTFYVKLSNGGPTVKIINPVNNAKYPLDKATSYTLGATVSGNTISSQIWQVKLRRNNREQLIKTTSGTNPVVDISPVGCDGDDYYYVITVKVTDYNNLSAQDSVKIYPDCSSPRLNIANLTATVLSSSSVRLNWTNPTLSFDKVLVVGKAGSALTDLPLETSYTANASFTGNGSGLPGGGKVLFQGTSASVVVTDLTAGQPYYFRVYTRAGNGWSGGVEVSTTPTSTTSSSPGSVSAVEANKCYRLVSRLSGKVLAVGPSAQNDADPILQLTDANKLSQGWRMTPTDGGFVSITTLATQKAIQVAGGSSADDALLEQWTYWGGSHQQWRLVRNGEGYVSLLNRNSGKALSVRNASLAEGASMSQMPLGTGFQQQWSIIERTCSNGARSGAPEASVSFRLWPNPARDHVLIDLSSAPQQSVDMYLNDLQGHTIWQTKLDVAPPEPYRLNTSQLPDGLYLIRLVPVGQSPTTLRLLIQR
ncbi:hypothetical protein GCM10028816_13830 [Spirosoma lituiforme]